MFTRGACDELVVRITTVVEVAVPGVVAMMFEEGVYVLHSVLSEHVQYDFYSLIYAWISIWSLGSPCCPGITLVVWVFSYCGIKVGSYDD
jgi:hypothetical protein